MNILMMTLMYPQDQLEEVTCNARDKLQNQINNYQRAFVEGIRSNLGKNEKLSILNCLPVGIYPLQYKQLVLRKGFHDQGTIQQLGCLNIPSFKQNGRYWAAVKAITDWVKSDPANRTVLVYTQYLPYMKALACVKKHFPALKVAVIVTDLPNELGLASGRKGLLRKIEYRIGRKSLELLRRMDGFVLLTEPMASALQIQDKPYSVIEGLILANSSDILRAESDASPIFLYTGTLESALGIREMLDAFADMPEYQLWICGQGNMRNEIEEYTIKHPNIHFFGFVPQNEALEMQAQATALLNPRQPDGLFTKYSFPSKTLEYMRSGKPVLCCKLEGIPDDYDPYLIYMDRGKEGVKKAVQKLMSFDAATRQDLGNAARNFVLTNKNPDNQCKKLLRLLRSL